jgi:hypothetical protein
MRADANVKSELNSNLRIKDSRLFLQNISVLLSITFIHGASLDNAPLPPTGCAAVLVGQLLFAGALGGHGCVIQQTDR